MARKAAPYIKQLEKRAENMDKVQIREILHPVIENMDFEDTRKINGEEFRFAVAKWKAEKEGVHQPLPYRTLCIFNSDSKLIHQDTGLVRDTLGRGTAENPPYSDLESLITKNINSLESSFTGDSTKGFDDLDRSVTND